MGSNKYQFKDLASVPDWMWENEKDAYIKNLMNMVNGVDYESVSELLDK